MFPHKIFSLDNKLTHNTITYGKLIYLIKNSKLCLVLYVYDIYIYVIYAYDIISFTYHHICVHRKATRKPLVICNGLVGNLFTCVTHLETRCGVSSNPYMGIFCLVLSQPFHEMSTDETERKTRNVEIIWGKLFSYTQKAEPASYSRTYTWAKFFGDGNDTLVKLKTMELTPDST